VSGFFCFFSKKALPPLAEPVSLSRLALPERMTNLFPELLLPSLSTRAWRRHLATFAALSSAALFTSSMLAATDSFSFTHIGILPDETTSEVVSLNDAMTLAGCSGSHFQQDVHPYTQHNASRWTPAEGLKALPLLPDSPADPNGAGARGGFTGGNDVTPDGTKLVFSAHTTPIGGRAAGMCNADGSNVVVFSTMPGGEKMQAPKQISDDATIVFGYAEPDYLHYSTSRWTAATGFEEVAFPAGYNNSGPSPRAISGDGSVSAGEMWNYDADGNVTTEQAYRWTAGSGMLGLGYLVADNRSNAYGLSHDGTMILGVSWKFNPDDSDGPTNLFIWKAGVGLKNIYGPSEAYRPEYGLSGVGISGDGSVVVVAYDYSFSSCNYNCDPPRTVSYIINPAHGQYVDLLDAISIIGGSDSIAGWKNFNISGVTDDGNTVYGWADNPDGRSEGFIAHFPAGFLANIESPARLLNISTRLRVGTGEKVSIAGFIVMGTVSKRLILRGIGPSLQEHGVTDALADPVLELHEPDGTVRTNDEWKATQQADIEATGVAPTNEHESALIATLAPGTYSAVLSGKGGTGIGLVEVYDLDQPINARMANISTRGFVDTGDNALIGGMIVGRGYTNVLIRAIGPSLQASGVSNALLDPTVEVRNADGTLYTENDDWQGSAVKDTGIAPSDPRESAMVVGLNPDNYTVIVRGKEGATGVALVEVYDLGQ
jgi:hypothetical protein